MHHTAHLTASAGSQAALAARRGAATRRVAASAKKTGREAPQQVDYGRDWYAQTRDATRRTASEEIARRREANRVANNGRERKDLYTDAWDGDVYKGSPVNILTLLAALFFLVPIVGLVFAFQVSGVVGWLRGEGPAVGVVGDNRRVEPD